LNNTDTFSLTFKGTKLGFERILAPDGGKLHCTVDGNKEANIDFWDKYSIHNSGQVASVLYYHLNNGKHTLKCEVSNKKIGKSTGRVCRITGLEVTAK